MRIVPAGPEAAEEAAEIIRSGGLVVIPTETVYGLAADALNPDAVALIFKAKGRPADNPLIVHVDDSRSVETIALATATGFEVLAGAFWPGPLTLVLPKRPLVPDITTGGLDTVAVRVPADATVRRMIELAGPIAAPSANRFTEVSP